MLLETFSAVETSAQKLSSVDCRVFERSSCELTTTCHPASLMAMKEAGWSATIRDISQGGVRLHLARRFEKGTPLAIELPGDETRDPSVVFAKVVHIKWEPDDKHWVLGCKFVSQLSDDELLRLLTLGTAKPEEATPEVVQDVILSNVHFHIAVRRGWQLKCHFKQFKATSCWPLVPGRIVHLNVGGADQTKSTFRVQLVECRQDADQWHFQAKLLRTPTLAELLTALAPLS